MLNILSQTTDSLNQLTNLGVAGLMGAMWLWERRTSRVREQQIDEAHARIMADRVMLDQLMDVVRQNAQAMTQLTATQQQLLHQRNASA
jgi:uncharacterized protein YigA (DUF484 family)